MVKWAGAMMALGVMVAGPMCRAAEPAAAIKVNHAALTPDPNVRQGTLPNGMRYLIMRNANPTGAVSLRFAIDVGSYEEADAQKGFAHFVEHMAFRSTRGFPTGGTDRMFAPWGVAFGRDQNAVTTTFSTTYQLDMPKPDQAQLKSAFGWLRDVADGIVFADDAVSRERGVVLAEMEARSSPLMSAQEAIAKFQAGGQRSVNRQPIGTQATLDAAKGADLQRFYDAWYRPEHAIVVVVGDLPVETMQAMVENAFSSWSDRGPKPIRAKLVQPTSGRPQDAFTVAGETLPTVLSACRIRPGETLGVDDVARLRRKVRTQAWQTILNQRLAQVTSANDKHLLGAAVMSNDARDLAGVCLIVMPTGDDWDEALRAAETEMDRFSKDGPGEAETEKAVETVRSRLRGAVLTSTSRGSPELANSLTTKALVGDVITNPADALYAYDLAVEDMTPDDVKASFAADWSGPAPLLVMTGPKPATREALLTAWTRGAGETPQARYAERATATWSYTAFGKPGKVVERTTIADPGFTRLRFANGLVLNFKQTKLELNKVDVRLSFGAGRREVDDNQYAAAEIGTSLVVAGGLAKNSIEDLRSLFDARAAWTFRLGMGPQSFAIRATAFSDDLDTQLQVLAAYMTDPGFRPALDARLPTAIDMAYRTFLTEPAAAVNIAVTRAVSPDYPGNPPPRDVMARLRSSDIERVFKPILTTAPIELTIVGDIDEASAVREASLTFGALPPRPTAARERVQPGFLRYPETSVTPIHIEHRGQPDKAAAQLSWPLYVSTPERRPEEYTLKLLAAVFDTALRRRVREELGKTYMPQVFTNGPDFGDQGVLRVAIDASPKDIDAIVAETRTVAAQLQAGDITPQMLEDARQPILAAARAQHETNAWWAGAMGGSFQHPAVLEEALKYEPLMSAVTVEDVRAAAGKWLAREPIVGVAYPAGFAQRVGQ
ncbi:hypothetical protein ASD38_16595 [Caulobacter sp. Root487D2Y]|uniref:M16 family metallopeptidase n=1 Tax=Caulobacter sp. Root487D2Y TaxID=1736547 RepID=UPI00071326C4|nr:M16 family metallopeptidase [Caulobacter sp. Root487D2Y]KQY28301.1 hypothetical protein ASD38_16595 [Caulobacter sp. Root487D2Y]